MPFERALSVEEINQINRQLAAHTHIAILLLDDNKYGYNDFAGAFDQLQSLLSAYIGTRGSKYFIGKESGWVDGIFFIYSRNRTYHYKCAKVKIIEINMCLGHGP